MAGSVRLCSQVGAITLMSPVPIPNRMTMPTARGSTVAKCEKNDHRSATERAADGHQTQPAGTPHPGCQGAEERAQAHAGQHRAQGRRAQEALLRQHRETYGERTRDREVERHDDDQEGAHGRVRPGVAEPRPDAGQEAARGRSEHPGQAERHEGKRAKQEARPVDGERYRRSGGGHQQEGTDEQADEEMQPRQQL
jgi:hypothetical protein